MNYKLKPKMGNMVIQLHGMERPKPNQTLLKKHKIKSSREEKQAAFSIFLEID